MARNPERTRLQNLIIILKKSDREMDIRKLNWDSGFQESLKNLESAISYFLPFTFKRIQIKFSHFKWVIFYQFHHNYLISLTLKPYSYSLKTLKTLYRIKKLKNHVYNIKKLSMFILYPPTNNVKYDPFDLDINLFSFIFLP